MSVIGEQTFSGVGRTKKRAKQGAAQKALDSFYPFQHPRQTERLMAASDQDFTVDEVTDVELDWNRNRVDKSATATSDSPSETKFQRCQSFRSSLVARQPKMAAETNDVGDFSTTDFPRGKRPAFPHRYSFWARQLDQFRLENLSVQTSVYGAAQPSTLSAQFRRLNPLAVLSDLRPNIRYSCHATGNGEERNPSRCRPRSGAVTIGAVVDGQHFHGSGRTVKQAKRHLAAQVLSTVFHFRFVGQNSKP